jgi:hypothetical protein
MNCAKKWKRVLVWAGGAFVLALGGTWWKWSRHASSLPLEIGLRPSSPSPGTRWPWRSAREQVLAPGVRQWRSKTGDGTELLLHRFDFGANGRLRFSIADNDADDEKPGDNRVQYWPRGVGQITKQLNANWQAEERKRPVAEQARAPRQVLAAVNGAFFGYADAERGPGGQAFHVGPVVLDGKVFFNGANHRWTFGTQVLAGREVFAVEHLPSRKQLEKFRWAAGSVQCLVKDGAPLKLEPFPRSRSDFKKQPVPSTPIEAGHVPVFDHMKTCRVSLAWSRDSRMLWLLVVKEPDIEAGSAVALKRGLPIGGGWTVPDVQRFWLSLRGVEKDGVWCAVNSDAGDVAQLVWKSGAGYKMIPPRWADGRMGFSLKSDFSNAPQGGPIMAFVISG